MLCDYTLFKLNYMKSCFIDRYWSLNLKYIKKELQKVCISLTLIVKIDAILLKHFDLSDML